MSVGLDLGKAIEAAGRMDRETARIAEDLIEAFGPLAVELEHFSESLKAIFKDPELEELFERLRLLGARRHGVPLKAAHQRRYQPRRRRRRTS